MSKVSVVIPTYRRDRELMRALVSLSEQSYSDFEIVLVDDNACFDWNQKVKKIISDFVETYPLINIKYIINDINKGSAITRNVGIEASNGEYITFLDDDDIYLPNKIEKQVQFMENGNFDYSITDLELFNDKDKKVDKRIRSYIKDVSSQALLEYHLKYHMTGTDTMMFRKDYICNIGGFPHIDVGDEFYLMHRAIQSGGRFGYLSTCDVKAYVHTGEEGLSSGKSKIDGENALYEYKRRYFKQISRKTVKYVKARHFAVIAYTYLKMRRWGMFIKYSCLGLRISFYQFCKILIKR